MSIEQRSLNTWALLAEWILANLIGWIVGLTVGIALTFAATLLPGLNPDRFSVYALLFSAGLATGLVQWRVMKQLLPNSARWVAATIAGYVLSLVFFTGISLAQPVVAQPWGDLLLMGLFGAGIGIPQWWVLRLHYHRAGIWVPATAAGFLCFTWLTSHPAHSFGELVAVGAVIGTLAAVVPGAALAWLTRR